MIALLASTGVVGLVQLLLPARLGRPALVASAALLAAIFVWSWWQWTTVRDGGALEQHVDWVGGLGLGLDVRFDAFSLLMVVLVAGIGALVFAYARSYLGTGPKTRTIAGLLTLFAGAMFGVVVADNLLFLYVCWELTSVTSYLLIGIDDEDADSRSAALHALLVTGLGGLVMLGGFVLLGLEAGTFRLSELVADPPSGTVTSVAVVLVLVGAMTKSAQYPFHSWLPGAMVAPTPISAYLHSAAMVKAGVYLVARFAPAFADTGLWRVVIVGGGLVTMIAGGLRALRPFDLKQVLAFGTVSQLGFLMVLFGIGHHAAVAAGCALLLAHGVFKAALFMAVGVLDHETGTRDLRRLPELGAGWGPIKAVVGISAASMAAVPLLAGFLAKEQAYAALVEGSTGDRFVLAGIVAGSILTVAYSARIAAAVLRPSLVADAAVDRVEHAHRPPLAFVAPAAVLATATVVLGLVPRVWSPLIDRAANALDDGAHAHLVLWHGVNTPLVLSLLTLATGVVVFVLRRPIARAQAAAAPPFDGVDVYRGLTSGMLRGAGRLTGIVQSGSLPVYAAVILATAAVLPLSAMVLGEWWPGWPDGVTRAIHVPLAALLIGAAVATTVARRRFAAAILLGLVGYGMAALFVVQGTPDLALTQFSVETLSVVVFLLVLRRLPDRFERPTPAVRQVVRLGVSALVGVFVTLIAIAASGWREGPTVSDDMPSLAYDEGEGRNVVNVILVDIRGLDTVGETTVLVTAAIGIAAIARAGQTPRHRSSPRRAVRRRSTP